MVSFHRVTVDDRCEACGYSVAERFPSDGPPAFCQACDDESVRELRAGHVTHALTGAVFLPAEGSAVAGYPVAPDRRISVSRMDDDLRDLWAQQTANQRELLESIPPSPFRVRCGRCGETYVGECSCDGATMPDRSLLHQTGSIEPHFNAQRQPEPDARCCPECCGLGRYLPTFSANYTVRCGTCGGAGWLKPEGRC